MNNVLNSQEECRIAILMIGERPFHQAMTSLFYDQIMAGKYGQFRTLICNMEASKDYIYATIKDLIINNKTDVFLTIGETCSLIAKEVLDEMGGHPTVFIGVRDPIKLQLVNSLDKPGFCLSGIVRQSSPLLTVAEKYVEAFPHIKQILIPYAADDDYLINQAEEIKHYLHSLEIDAVMLPINNNPQTILEAVYENAPEGGGIILLEGCYSNIVQDGIAYLCWQKGIVLCGSGPYAIDAGAACALNGSFNQVTEEAYLLIQAFWKERKPLGQFPVKILSNNDQFVVNIDLCRSISTPATLINSTRLQTLNIEAVREWTEPYTNDEE